MAWHVIRALGRRDMSRVTVVAVGNVRTRGDGRRGAVAGAFDSDCDHSATRHQRTALINFGAGAGRKRFCRT